MGSTSGESCCEYIYIYDGVVDLNFIVEWVANSGTIPLVDLLDLYGKIYLMVVTGQGFALQ